LGAEGLVDSLDKLGGKRTARLRDNAITQLVAALDPEHDRDAVDWPSSRALISRGRSGCENHFISPGESSGLANAWNAPAVGSSPSIRRRIASRDTHPEPGPERSD
jgi:hypothetical protein